MAMWMFFLGVGLASIAAVSSEASIEAQDPSMKIDDAPETNVKRWHNGCSRRCYYYRCPNGYYCDGYRCCRPNNQRPCSHNAHCPQGWSCVSGRCKAQVSCTSASSCSASQCCYKLRSLARGWCYNWCLVKYSSYHCDCADGYVCKPRNSYYWGKCEAKPTPKPTPKPPPSCSSDDGCEKSQCCSGGKCRPLKKANEWCPHKGADTFNCGCIEGYFCKPYELHKYWGKCEEEESGSGFAA